MSKITAALLVLTLFSIHPTVAAEPTRHGNAAVISLAESYLAAYARLDLAVLERLYAENAVFNDPTSADVPGIGGPFVWSGRREILTRIGDWRKTIRSLNYDVERVYESSNQVVFVGEVKPLVVTSKGPIQYGYPIVTIVTIANGVVTEHRDYTNYAAGRVAPPASQ